MKILLLETDLQIQNQITNCLKSFDPSIHFYEADTGFRGAQMLRENTFDILIMEIELPDIRGDLLVDFIHTATFKIGITASFGNYEIRRKFDEFLLKPLFNEELKRVYLNATFFSRAPLAYGSS